MFDYKLKPYTPLDKNFVYETKKQAYKTYVEQNWGEWNEKTQQELFEKFIEKYGPFIQIIMNKTQAIGFFHGEELDEHTYEIQNICIIPACQGKGIGTNIIKNLLNKHKNKNIQIRCFKQNPVKKLYERLGFKLTKETEFHYHLTKHKGDK